MKKAWIRIAMLATLTLGGTIALSAEAPKPAADRLQPAAGAAAADDNMTPYRMLAADTLQAFKAHDMATTKKKARELEVAWDGACKKALQKKSPALWGQIDKAMDDFIKLPCRANSTRRRHRIQAAYDTFIAKLELAVKS